MDNKSTNDNSMPLLVPTKTAERNVAFDIARIIAMFLIVASHFMWHGGFNYHMVGYNYVLGRILNSFFKPSVDIFVLISAYFTCTSAKIKWQRLSKLYLQVWTYSMALFVAFLVVNGKESFDKHWLLSSIFPIIFGKYWFFSSYIFLMLISPLLNIVIKNLNKKAHLVICVLVIVVGSISGDGHLLDNMSIHNGYSVVWFSLLYFIGAYVRKYDVRMPKNFIFIPIVIYVTMLVCGYFILASSHSSLVSSASATTILILLKNVNIRPSKGTKFITRLSARMFGVYLIHDSHEMRGYMYHNIFHCGDYYDSKYAFLIMLGFIAATFVGCILVEEVRQTLESIIESFIPNTQKYAKRRTYRIIKKCGNPQYVRNA